MEHKRNPMPCRPVKDRISDFYEVALGYTDEQAIDEARRCLNCKDPKCVKGCPVGIDIPGFIGKIKSRDPDGALETVLNDSTLPAVCGRVCPQETQCEKFCVLGRTAGGAVAIGNLERYAADRSVYKSALFSKPALPQKARAAIVGSGPASLACAGELQLNGIQTILYEALHKAGGVLVYGIPEFRLPKALVQKEIGRLKALGVQIVTDAVAGKSVTAEELRREFDFVFLGTGAGLPLFLNIKGENFAECIPQTNI